jgi:HSP20 family protein
MGSTILDVTLSEHSVTLHAKTARDETEEQSEYYRREMASGEFQRTIGLPENVNSAKAKAKFADGILDVTIPKTETTKRHKIMVQ